VVPPKQVLPETQPVQQTPPRQVPFLPLLLQVVLSALLPEAHTPVAQDMVLQVLVEEHLLHSFPPLPQLVLFLPSWHLEPSQQPLQQAPLRHLPPLQEVPLLLLEYLQAPEEQATVLHTWLLQVTHLTPPLPQLLMEPLDTHLEPVQQPLQQLPL